MASTLAHVELPATFEFTELTVFTVASSHTNIHVVLHTLNLKLRSAGILSTLYGYFD